MISLAPIVQLRSLSIDLFMILYRTRKRMMRDKDPVHGCLGVIAMLQNQVLNLKDELAIAHDQLYLLQRQQQNFHSQQSQLQLHALQGTSFATVTSSGVHDIGHVHGSSNAAAMQQL